MADVEKALVTILKATAEVAALVSTRVFFAEAPQSAPLPFILLTRVNTNFVHSLTGFSELSNARIQIDCYAKTQKEARSVGTAVRQSIDSFRGEESGITINGIIILDSMDGFDDSPDLRRVTQDYHVWYNEE